MDSNPAQLSDADILVLQDSEGVWGGGRSVMSSFVPSSQGQRKGCGRFGFGCHDLLG